MKTRIILSSLLTVIFLLAFSGCNITKKAVTQTGFAGRVILPADSNYSDYTDETILNGNSNYNSQGKTVSYSEETTDGYTTDGIAEDNSNYEDEEILNENPNSEEVDLSTLENSLSSEGNFVEITQEEIDPDANVSSETVNCDEDIYTNVIWIPSVNYIHAGWHPYSNGRWVWSHYGWTWKSYYRWGTTYHYGRWWYSRRYGWVWSPGRRWAPAWVIWGHHNNYESWYPISPRIRIKHKNGVISPVMPRNKQNGWVIVKRNDFTKDVNSSTMISNTKTNDIIKKSAISITLKQDGKNLFNEGNIKKYENVKQSSNDKKSDVQVITKQQPNKNSNTTVQVTNNKQNNNLNKKTKVDNNTIVNETKKKVMENKNSITVPPTSNKKQNNTVTNNQNKTVENKIPVKNIQEKKNVMVTSTPVNKQNNSVNNNKSNTTENKIVVKDNQKKTIETQPISVEKNRNINNNTNNNTKTAPKVEQTPKVIQTPKVEQTPKIQQTPKVEQTPKINKEPVNNTQQKTITKKEGN
ncbi:MAG: hypothetical protein NTU73_07410 [Ignavibacteriae bacterium]|nr:hypothetical protein [Ignavibacteriota bacterium]